MLIEKVKKTITSYQLVNDGEHILLALSGGVDSTALLWILLKLRDELKFGLTLAHLNHQIRGEDADKDEQFVRDLAKETSLKLKVGRYNVPKLARKEGLSMEEAARKARYQFLFQSAEGLKANRIALAHNRDDCAETFLINLLRGSGCRGLSAMKPVQGKLIRPLIECPREEIEEFLQQEGQSYRLDLSNLDIKYTRNKVRHSLIPYLEKHFNPNIKEILAQEMDILREEDDYFRAKTSQIFYELCYSDINGVHIKVNPFVSLPLAIKRRLIRLAIEKAKGDIKRITWAHISSILQLFSIEKEEKRVMLPQGLRGRRLGKEVVIEPEMEEKKVEFSHKVSIPGHIKIQEIDEDFIIRLERASVVGNNYIQKAENRAFLDADKVAKEFLVRNRKEGDRFFPLGSQGERKLKSFFIDKKIPRKERDKIPLFISRGKIAWVAGLAIAESFKINPSTQQVVIIERGKNGKGKENITYT